jgi:hypothetical protein
MKNLIVFTLFLLISITSGQAQSVILTDKYEKAQEVLRFDQLNDDELLFRICSTQNHEQCKEIGIIGIDDINSIVSREKKQRNYAGIASVGALALTATALYFGIYQESSAAFMTGIIGSTCAGIPFAIFMKKMDQYMLRSQTEGMLNEINECSLGEVRNREAVNFNMLKNYLINLAN